MKKMLLTVLILALTVCLCACSAGHKVISDPVLEPVMIDGIPEGTYTNLGDGRILVNSLEDNTMVIHDVQTGTSIPIIPRDEDKDMWFATLVDICMREGEVFTQKDIDYHFSLDTQELFRECLLYTGLHPDTIGQRYALLPVYSAVLDIKTGTLSAFQVRGSHQAMTSWDQVFSATITSEEVVCTLFDVNGNQRRTAELPHEGYLLTDVRPFKNVILLSFIQLDREPGTNNIKFVLLDRKLNIKASVQFDIESTMLLDTKLVHYSPETDQILVRCIDSSNHLNDLLLLDMLEQTCVRVDNAPEYSHIIGMSADGSYALITSSENRLYKLDMRSLIFTQQMSAQEIAEAGLGFLGLPTWDGGEYAVSPQCIFRVKER